MTEVKYTEFAAQAVGLADIFNEAFKRPLPGRPANYRVQLAVPDGPSTAGGKQGTQHIKLVPIGSGPTLVAGWANQADREAEIRSWEHLKSIMNERAGGGAPDEAAYRKLVLEMKRFFEDEKLAVSVVAARREVEDAPPAKGAESSSSSILIILGIVGVLAVGAIIAALVLIK